MLSPSIGPDGKARSYFRPSIQSSLPCFVFSFFLLLWAYGFLVFNFSISIDEEFRYSALFDQNREWLRTGRWAVYFFKFVFDDLEIAPFFSGIAALLALAGAAAALQIGFRKARPLEASSSFADQIIVGLVFPVIPVFVFILSFATFDVESGLGIFISVLSALLTFEAVRNRERVFKFIVPALLLGCATAVYQPMLIVWGASILSFLLASVLLSDVQPERPQGLLRPLVQSCLGVAAGAFLFYKAVDWLVILRVGRSPYLDGYLHWTHEPFPIIAHRLGGSWKDVLLGSAFQAGAGWRLLLGLQVAAGGVILWHARKRGRFWLAAVILVVLFFSPFAISAVTGTALPIRTMFPLAIVFTAPVVIAWHLLRSHRVRLGMLALLALAAAQNLQWINRVLLADFRRYQYDATIANGIGMEVQKLCVEGGDKTLKVAVVGMVEAPSDIFGYKCETLGSSLFEWSGGDPYRACATIRSMGYGCVVAATKDDMRVAIQESSSMKPWPLPTSVRRRKDLVVVKLSEPTPAQVSRFATPQ